MVVVSAAPMTTTEYFTQDFYHAWMVPLLLITAVLAWTARPSTKDELPKGFRRYQFSYLSVWAVCVAADWLQGPYVYALYAAYGFTGAEIAQLFVAGFGSSMVFGCFVGSITDRFGRKNCCLAYCVLYILSCLTKHYQSYAILMVGRVTGGIATSMLFSCFECWMVSEHLQRNKFSGSLLGYMFGTMFTIMYVVAILSGLAGQFVADSWTFHPTTEGGAFHVGGYCAPFDLAILCLIVGMILIASLWDENYGHTNEAEESGSIMENLSNAAWLLRTDSRMALLCIVVSCFEGSMFAFVFNWTPALDSKTVPPPHGIIFAMFMMACMCGASMSSIVGGVSKASHRLLAAFGISVLTFVVASSVTIGEQSLMTCFVAFLLFEFCVGLYFPSIGVLKSDIVPEKIRGTMYNVYRVPLNAIVVALLLSNITMSMCFKLCAVLLTIALIAMTMLQNYATKPSFVPLEGEKAV